MNSDNNVLYVGVDVDDNRYHGALMMQDDQIIEFDTKPDGNHLAKKINKLNINKLEVKTCYEAGYLGFSLQRQLTQFGISCEVIAPSRIPVKPGDRVKTDRIDAKKLAIYYKKGLLTSIRVPDEQDESVRAVIRSRKKLVDGQKSLKTRINGWLRPLGIRYRSQMGKSNASYWTLEHKKWLREVMINLKNEHYKFDLKQMLDELEFFEQKLCDYTEQIQRIVEYPRYKNQVSNLIAYRGLSTLSAITLIIEIQDIQRFSHPRQLTSYAGMDIIEKTSGGKERKYSMSLMGNRYIRTTVIEACQCVLRAPKIGKTLKERRRNVKEEAILIADKCMKRLHKKAMKLLLNNKSYNKIKAACAREMLGFIWESLKLETPVSKKTNAKLAVV